MDEQQIPARLCQLYSYFPSRDMTPIIGARNETLHDDERLLFGDWLFSIGVMSHASYARPTVSGQEMTG